MPPDEPCQMESHVIFYVVSGKIAITVNGEYSKLEKSHCVISEPGSYQFVYVGMFSAAKIPMLTFEIGFLGLKFSMLRLILTIPVFILIAFIMEKRLRNTSYEITSPE